VIWNVVRRPSQPGHVSSFIPTTRASPPRSLISATIETSMALHSRPDQGWTIADREWILRTYKECLYAGRKPEPPMKIPDAALTASRTKK
jgi:hypothetical protein